RRRAMADWKEALAMFDAIAADARVLPENAASALRAKATIRAHIEGLEANIRSLSPLNYEERCRLRDAEAQVRELEGLIRTLVSAITPLHNAHMPIERELISDEDVEAAQEALRRVMVLAPNLFYPSDTAIATTEQDHD